MRRKRNSTHSSDLSNLLLPLNVSLDPKTQPHSFSQVTYESWPVLYKSSCQALLKCHNTRALTHTHSLTGTHTYLPVSGGHAALFAASDGLVRLSLAGQQATVSAVFFSRAVWQAAFTAATTASAGYVDILIRGSHALLTPVRLPWADVGLTSV